VILTVRSGRLQEIQLAIASLFLSAAADRCSSALVIYRATVLHCGARGGAVGCGTALQAGRSRVRFPMMLLEFVIDTILPAVGSIQPLPEVSTRNSTTFMCRLPRSSGRLNRVEPPGVCPGL
jgi:hypothetical protein